ncbi:hypothetical protein DSOL_4504 [Desulfosporosinus metallidurans]|uniref:Uncharacterized protein n=1 Tax=Desulfosporosinus metallidurans TaxID=1888891 RepID=A0A1Q8QJP5_9FIRM|nr:hypothetical protein DSOL_4504 [Desulfosporosinus metallidurans]
MDKGISLNVSNVVRLLEEKSIMMAFLIGTKLNRHRIVMNVENHILGLQKE